MPRALKMRQFVASSVLQGSTTESHYKINSLKLSLSNPKLKSYCYGELHFRPEKNEQQII